MTHQRRLALRARSPGRQGKLLTRIRRLLRLGSPVELQQVRIELDILRPGPVEAPFNERKKDHTLIDDNPCGD